MRAGCAAALLLTGCALVRDEASPPPAAPEIAARIVSFAGSPLAGPLARATAEPVDGDPARALVLECAWSFVPALPLQATEALTSVARLVLATRSDQPLRAAGERLQRVRVDFAPVAAGELLAEQVAALPAGASVVLGVEVGTEGALGLVVHRAGADAPLLLAVGADASLARPSSAQEIGVLERPLPADGAPLAVAWPLASGGALLARVSARPGPAEAALLERCLQDIAAEQRGAADRAAELSRADALLRQLLSAYDAVELAENQRPALVYLAAATRAPLAEDLALVAADDELTAYAAAVQAASTTQGVEDLGWLLERAAWSVVAALAEAGKLPPELDGVLLAQAGELARHPAAIEELLTDCPDAGELQRRLLAENRVFLEDSLPGARARAHAWLSARGAAVPGFDALAPAAERRAALAAAGEQP